MTKGERFWTNVNRRGPRHPTLGTRCWVWTGGRTRYGHGQLSARDLAHRVSYSLHVAPIPVGLYVLHRCDRPWCVRPDHLTVGTQADNMADMVAKGRQARGERVAGAKLTEGKVREARRRYRPGCLRNGTAALAGEFGVTPQAMFNALAGRTWRHVRSSQIPSTLRLNRSNVETRIRASPRTGGRGRPDRRQTKEPEMTAKKTKTEKATKTEKPATAKGAKETKPASDKLSGRQVRALAALAKAKDGRLSRKELAEKAEIDPTGISNTVGYLDEEVNSRPVHAGNLLNRKFVKYIDATESEPVRVAITDKGRAALADAVAEAKAEAKADAKEGK